VLFSVAFPIAFDRGFAAPGNSEHEAGGDGDTDRFVVSHLQPASFIQQPASCMVAPEKRINYNLRADGAQAGL
jgi:hypothetical protein